MPEVGVSQGCLIPIPDAMGASEATLLEPVSCCVNGLRYSPMDRMEHVVILGAGIIGVLNVIEGFFAKLTRKRLRRGVFKSVAELKTAIDE